MSRWYDAAAVHLWHWLGSESSLRALCENVAGWSNSQIVGFFAFQSHYCHIESRYVDACASMAFCFQLHLHNYVQDFGWQFKNENSALNSFYENQNNYVRVSNVE